MSTNKDRHIHAFKEYHQHLFDDEPAKAEVRRVFCAESEAVADLSADFHIETVGLVFQRYALPKGKLTFCGRPVNPAAIRRTALLTMEGGRGRICAIDQTLAAQDLTPNLRLYMPTHCVQPNVGHYGVLSGKRWQNHLYPVVRDAIHALL